MFICRPVYFQIKYFYRISLGKVLFLKKSCLYCLWEPQVWIKRWQELTCTVDSSILVPWAAPSLKVAWLQFSFQAEGTSSHLLRLCSGVALKVLFGLQREQCALLPLLRPLCAEWVPTVGKTGAGGFSFTAPCYTSRNAFEPRPISISKVKSGLTLQCTATQVPPCIKPCYPASLHLMLSPCLSLQSTLPCPISSLQSPDSISMPFFHSSPLFLSQNSSVKNCNSIALHL